MSRVRFIQQGSGIQIGDTAKAFVISAEIANGTYSAGSDVFVSLIFSEAINTSGLTASNTSVTLNIGGNLRTAVYDASRSSQAGVVGEAANRLVFKYTVQPGESDTDGIALVANSLTVGGTVTDRASTPNVSTGGNFNFSPVQNSAAIIPTPVVADTVAPTATITTVAGSPTDATATFTVVFSEAVQGVTAADFQVTGTGVSGTVTGVTAGAGNSYTVSVGSIAGAGQMSLDIVNAGITDLAGNPVGTETNTGGVRTVDRVGPTVASIAVANGAYNEGDSVSVTVAFSEAVTVTGTPQLTLDIGGGRTANYASGSGTDALVFTYTVAAGVNDADGIAVGANALSLNGGTIADSFGNAAAISNLAVAANTAATIDTAAPTVSSIAVANGAYRLGETVSVTVTFSEAVTVADGTPTLMLDIGGEGRTANYASGSGTNALVFTYTVAAGVNDADGIAVGTNALSLNGATIRDASGNPATLANAAVAANRAATVDTVAPTAMVNAISGGLVNQAEANSGVLISGRFTTDAGDGTKIFVTVGSGAAVEATLSGDEWSTTLTTAQIAALGDGTGRTVTVTAKDAADNTNTYQSPSFVVDRTAPAPTIALAAGSDTGLSTTDGITKNATPTVIVTLNDTVEVNDRVQLYVNGSATGAAVTITAAHKAAGSVAVTTPDLGADGPKNLTVQMTDAADNVGPQPTAIAVKLDRTNPGTPTSSLDLTDGSDSGVSPTDDVTNVLTPTVRAFLNGTGAVVGDTVEILEGGTKVGSAVLSTEAQITNGFVDVALTTALAQGQRTLTMRVVDVAGGVGTAGGSLTLTVDTTARNAPSAAVTLLSDTGSSASDNITNASNPTVRVDLAGTGAIVGDRVQLLVDGAVVGSPVTLQAGDIAATQIDVVLNGLGVDGVKQITARVIDPPGNVGAQSPVREITLDRVAPVASVITIDLLAASDSANGGGTNADDRTNTRGPTFDVGFGSDVKAGDQVQLFVDGVATGPAVTVDADAVTARQVQVTAGDLGADGPKTITARITDVAGSQSDVSPSLAVTLDRTAPGAAGPITMQATVASDTGSSQTDRITTVQTPQVTISLASTGAVAGDTVTLNVDGVANKTVTLTQDDITAAAVTFNTNMIAERTVSLTAFVTDRANNSGGAGTALSVTVDRTAPAAPTVDLNAASDSAAGTGANDDNLTNVATPSVRVTLPATGGLAVAGDSVQVFVGGTASGASVALTATDIAAGFVDVTTGALGTDGLKTITARITDVASNQGAASAGLAVTLDRTAPNAPTTPIDLAPTGAPADDTGYSQADNVTSNTTPTVRISLAGTGATEGDVLQLRLGTTDSGAPVTLTARHITDGFVDVTTGALGVDGVKSLTARVTDKANNVGTEGGTLSVTLDTTPPGAPTTLVDLAAGSDSGTDVADNRTNVETASFIVSLAGTGAVAGDRVRLTTNQSGSDVAISADVEVTADAFAAGQLSITTNRLAAGEQTIKAQVIDVAGSDGPLGGGLTITVDRTAPPAPTAIDLTDASDSANGDGTSIDNLTNVKVQSYIVGFNAEVDAGDEVQLFATIGGTTVATGAKVILNDTQAAADSVTLTTGDLSLLAGVDLTGATPVTITARITDRVGNQGPAGTAKVDVSLDTTAPTSPSTQIDLDTASDSNCAGAANGSTDNLTNDTTPTVTISLAGTGAVEGDTVQLFVDGVANGLPVRVGADASSVKVTAQTLAEGSRILTATITDRAGGASSPAGGSLTITIDTTAPVRPEAPDLVAASDSGSSDTDNRTNDDTPTIEVTLPDGSATGDLVELRLGGDTVGNGVVTQTDINAGKIAITTASLGLDGAKAITARITDLSNNEGQPSSLALTITLDRQAPAPSPADITVDDTDLSFGQTVTVAWDATSITDVASVSVDFSAIGGGSAVAATRIPSGEWVASYTPAVGLEMSGSVKVRYTDTSGNSSNATAAGSEVVVDTKKPTAATNAMDLLAAFDTGVSDADNITKAETVSVKALLAGTGAKVGDTIQLVVNNADVGTAVMLASATEHTFTDVALTRSGSGTDNVIQFRIIDAIGNAGPNTGTLTIVGDNGAPPNVPTAAPTLKASSDTGFSASDRVTSATTPTIVVSLAGTNAVAGDVVKLYDGVTPTGSTLTLTAEQATAGSVEMVTGTLADGVRTITARVMDKAGHETSASPALSITVDTTAPAATITDAMAQTSPSSGALVLYGSGFDTILNGTEDATTNVKDRLDFTKITLDTTTALVAADVASATVTNAGTLTITLAASGQSKLAAAAVDGSVVIAVGANFLADAAGSKGTASFGSTPVEINFQLTTVNFGANETLNVANYAPSGTIIVISGTDANNSANNVTVGGSGKTTITAHSGSGSVTLEGFTGSLDGSQVQFADGTVLKRNTGGATAINGTAVATSGAGDQLIAGNSGDILRGLAGDDLLIGGNGKDAIYGDTGNDTITGGRGDDFLSGGAGQDKFVFDAAFGADRIADFTAGSSADSIDLQDGWTAALGTGGILTVRDGGGTVMGTIALLGQSFANQAAADDYLATITFV
ncbi:MAG: beta strand repeat-containing protein [Rhodospirillales bacterium]